MRGGISNERCRWPQRLDVKVVSRAALADVKSPGAKDLDITCKTMPRAERNEQVQCSLVHPSSWHVGPFECISGVTLCYRVTKLNGTFK